MFKKFVVFVFIALFSLVYFGCENSNMPTQEPLGSSELNLNLIPAGADLESATLILYAGIAPGETVFIHRITADWMENTVTWNSFGGSYDPAPFTSFIPTAASNSVDLTGLVEQWLDGTYPNYGILLRQDEPSVQTGFHSSEYDGNPDHRPKLVLSYWENGSLQQITIQRDVNGEVSDAYITNGQPDSNYGIDGLTIRNLNGLVKQALIKFKDEYVPTGPGTGTPGYWKNHPEAWPVDEITIGGITYPKAEAIGYMQDPVSGDKLFTMFPALVAAKLNVLIGNDASCISATISAADNWMATYGPIGVNSVPASSEAWEEGEPLYEQLDEYNNGLLCAPPRD
jgi:hypothetical protein